MKKLIALAVLSSVSGIPASAIPAGFTAALTSTNNPGALGYLVDNVPQDLTDCCKNKLMAK